MQGQSPGIGEVLLLRGDGQQTVLVPGVDCSLLQIWFGDTGAV